MKKEKRKMTIDLLKKTLKVPLRFHWSAALLPLLLIYMSGLVGLLYWIMIFGAVTFHEYGHVYEAVSQGMNPKYVSIHMFGGFAVIGKMKLDEPKKEVWLALAGPLASLLLAVITIPFVALTASPYVAGFFALNIMICAFNLIPAYPMDGGRILNGILSVYLGYRKAINISAIVSYCLAGFGLIISILNGYIWLGMVCVLVAVLAYSNKKYIENQLDTIGHY